MNKLYFAKDKVTKKIYSGMKNQMGFSSLANLKRSITHMYNYEGSTKTYDDFEFYCIDSGVMEIERMGE